jgi:hypothetical protein
MAFPGRNAKSGKDRKQGRNSLNPRTKARMSFDPT